MVDDDTGDVIARIFDTETPDIWGAWRWWVSPFYKIDNLGSAQTGAEAKQLAKELLAAQKN